MTQHLIKQIPQNYLLPALGIACNLGWGKEAICQQLFGGQEPGMEHFTMTSLSSGKIIPTGRLPLELPTIGGELSFLNSRNNALLKIVLDQIEDWIDLAKQRYGKNRIAVVLGTSTSGMAEGEQGFIHKTQTGQWPTGYNYTQQEIASPSLFAALYCDVTGPAYTLSTACSSSGKALCSARRLLEADLCDAVITGGVDTLCQLTLNGFDSLELLSSSICTPFSQNRSGITIGEGAAVFLMTKEALIPSMESPIVYWGGGESSDAYHINSPEPEGQGAEQAIREALHQANLETSDISYVNLHGTGTKLNDRMESICTHRLFGPTLRCSSTKAYTGHTLGAAGALEAAFLWLSLSQDNGESIPIPSHGWDNQQDQDLPQLSFSEAGDRIKSHSFYALMSNSFAFGGSNVSIILGKEAL